MFFLVLFHSQSRKFFVSFSLILESFLCHCFQSLQERTEPMEKNPQFRPSDTDLIMQLLKFVAGKCLPTEGLIVFVDVYSIEPWQLIGDMSSKKTHYFLTQLKKKKPTDARFNRTTCNGTWTQQNKGKKILDEDESLIIGYKRSLTYKHKKDSSFNGRWLMMEYFLADSLLQELKSNEAKEFVICAIKKNPRSEIRGNSVASVVEYKRFIDRFLQEQSTMILSDNSPVRLESTSSDVFSMGQLQSKDGVLVIINQTDSDEFFGMVNVENQECYYQEGDEEEVDWESILDFGDHGSVQNDLLY
ncbi:NAC transcription factor 29-like [Nicotiana tomentosiformis]|uniref:NAC transcription factor 29-like n=1 Tax=Nicotiana tomentosiformis TaxID=4098 RepID=UPI00388CB5DC